MTCDGRNRSLRSTHVERGYGSVGQTAMRREVMSALVPVRRGDSLDGGGHLGCGYECTCSNIHDFLRPKS